MVKVLVNGILRCLKFLAMYYTVLASAMILIRVIGSKKGIKAGEWFRKLLHMIQFMSILPVSLIAGSWMEASITELIMLVLIWIVILLFSKISPGLAEKIINARYPGELNQSLLETFLTYWFLFTLYGLATGDAWRMIVATAVITWGWSDMIAALMGKRFGYHKVSLRFVDRKKSWEGTASDAVVSMASSFIVLICFRAAPTRILFIISAVLSCVSAASELMSRGGHDTFIVPLCNSICLYILLVLFHFLP